MIQCDCVSAVVQLSLPQVGPQSINADWLLAPGSVAANAAIIPNAINTCRLKCACLHVLKWLLGTAAQQKCRDHESFCEGNKVLQSNKSRKQGKHRSRQSRFVRLRRWNNKASQRKEGNHNEFDCSLQQLHSNASASGAG